MRKVWCRTFPEVGDVVWRGVWSDNSPPTGEVPTRGHWLGRVRQIRSGGLLDIQFLRNICGAEHPVEEMSWTWDKAFWRLRPLDNPPEP